MFKRFVIDESAALLTFFLSLSAAWLVAAAAEEPWRTAGPNVLLGLAATALVFALLRSALRAREEKRERLLELEREATERAAREASHAASPRRSGAGAAMKKPSKFVNGGVGPTGTVRGNYTEADIGIDGDVHGDVSDNTHRPKR